jgi:hypothetical protein
MQRADYAGARKQRGDLLARRTLLDLDVSGARTIDEADGDHPPSVSSSSRGVR